MSTARQQQVDEFLAREGCELRYNPNAASPVEVSFDDGKTWRSLKGVIDVQATRNIDMRGGRVEEIHIVVTRRVLPEPEPPPF